MTEVNVIVEGCDFCGGRGEITFEDPVTGFPASMRCPECTPPGEELHPIVESNDDQA
jgi:hypothetical protein